YLGDIYQLYSRTANAAGAGKMILSACGYSLGAAYHPTWMDWPWIHPSCEVIVAPGMVFYLHMGFLDQATATAMAIADTSLVSDSGSERLTTPPLDLIEV